MLLFQLGLAHSSARHTRQRNFFRRIAIQFCFGVKPLMRFWIFRIFSRTASHQPTCRQKNRAHRFCVHFPSFVHTEFYFKPTPAAKTKPFCPKSNPVAIMLNQRSPEFPNWFGRAVSLSSLHDARAGEVEARGIGGRNSRPRRSLLCSRPTNDFRSGLRPALSRIARP